MKTIEDLLLIMSTLRDPQKGCPWDREQTFNSLAHYTLEEAYEVVETIEHGEFDELKDELGDLMFQVVFHAQLATEKGYFEFSDIVQSICDKLIRRHPHVFSDAKIESAAHQTQAWEAHKQVERTQKSGSESQSVLDGVTGTLPATTRAIKLQKRAASVGFDWKSITPIFDKVVEELEETRTEVLRDDLDAIEDEMGDLFFAVTNLARHAQVDPETALRRANRKFEDRFRALERRVQDMGLDLQQQSQTQLEALWQEIKRQT